jgi:HK97 family phage portal protein
MAWYDTLLPYGLVEARRQARFERSLGRAILGRKDVTFEGGLSSFLANPAEAAYKASKDYKNVAEYGYLRNVYLFRAINLIAEAAAGISWKLYNAGTSERAEIDSHPLLTLLNKRPNQREGAGEFMIALVSYWLLAGDTYAVALRGTTSARSTRKTGPAEIYALRPDRIKPIVTEGSGELTGYEYTRDDGGKIEYDVEDVLHARRFNPLSEYSGVSPARVAGRAVDQHNAANEWNTALLQNFGRFPAVITTETQLTPEQRDKLKEQFRERYSGPKNAGKPIFGDGGVFSVQKTSDTASDMDWLAGKMAAMREVATAFGIAPELLGDGAAKTFSNMHEARASMYTEVVLPMLDILRSPVSNWLFPMYAMDPGAYDLDVDKDGIEALQEDRALTWERANAPNSPLTVNERRELLGKDPVDDGDVILVSSSMVPLEQAVAEPDQIPDPLAGGQNPQGPSGEGENPDDVNPAQDRALPPAPSSKVANRRPFVRPAPLGRATRRAPAHSRP